MKIQDSTAFNVIDAIHSRLLNLDYKLVLTGSFALQKMGLLASRNPKDMDFNIHVDSHDKAKLIVSALEKLNKIEKSTYVDGDLNSNGKMFISVLLEGITVDIWIIYSDIKCITVDVLFHNTLIKHPLAIFSAKVFSQREDLAKKCLKDLNDVMGELEYYRNYCINNL